MSGESFWTLDELCAAVSEALAIDYSGVPSERVRDVPDRRTVRFYTTLGLVDRPTIRGRTALYGRRHLTQLVAIKRLQSQGSRLEEVQRLLFSLTDAELEALARLPEHLYPPTRSDEEPVSKQREFWKTPPAPPKVAPLGERPLLGLPLGNGVVLMAPVRREPDPADLRAVRDAAESLLRLLRERRLID